MSNSHFRSNAGIHVFERSLQRVLVAEGKSDSNRESEWALNPAAIVRGTANTFAKGIQIQTDQILAGLHARLGLPPSPAPVQSAPTTLASPPQSSMAQCINFCQGTPPRTAEQCFDSCNKWRGSRVGARCWSSRPSSVADWFQLNVNVAMRLHHAGAKVVQAHPVVPLAKLATDQILKVDGPCYPQVALAHRQQGAAGRDAGAG